MNYCEKCNIVFNQDFCPNCGDEKLRKAKLGDFCFLVEYNVLIGEMFNNILSEENIPSVAIPSGSGVRTAFALKLENVRIYVVFEFYEKASEILKNFSNDFKDKQNKELFDNIDKLFATKHSEKKMKKRLKLKDSEDFFGYCKAKILNCEQIVDEGLVSGCAKGGHYLFVYTPREIITINSITYQILAVKRLKALR